jgi:hypothetical protein
MATFSRSACTRSSSSTSSAFWSGVPAVCQQCALRPGTVHSADGWGAIFLPVLSPVIELQRV